MRLQNTKMKIIYSLTILWTLVWQAQLSHAVREGTTNTKVMIQRYEREGNFAKAALWHEAAADCPENHLHSDDGNPNSVLPASWKKRTGRPELWRVGRYKEAARISSEGCEDILGEVGNGGIFVRTSGGTRENRAVYLNVGADLPESVLPLRYLPQFFQSGTEDFQKEGGLCRCLKS